MIIDKENVLHSDLCFVRQNELILLERPYAEIELKLLGFDKIYQIFFRGEYYQVSHLMYFNLRENKYDLLGHQLEKMMTELTIREKVQDFFDNELPDLSGSYGKVYLVTNKGIIVVYGGVRDNKVEALVTNRRSEAEVLTRLAEGLKHDDELKYYITELVPTGLYGPVAGYTSVVAGRIEQGDLEDLNKLLEK